VGGIASFVNSPAVVSCSVSGGRVWVNILLLGKGVGLVCVCLSVFAFDSARYYGSKGVFILLGCAFLLV
jgi:hypothetical protein